MIGLAHLVWGPLGVVPVRRFLSSYRGVGAGAEHELIMVLNGVDAQLRREVAEELEGTEHRLLELAVPVQDLIAYREAARRLEHERLCFVNSHGVVLAPGWLGALDGALAAPGVGIVGASGSWGSIHSYLRFSLGLGGFYTRVFNDRRATIATLEAIAQRQERETPPSSARRRRVPVLTYAAAVLDQAHGFGRFPAPHIRTTGFMLHAATMRTLRIEGISSKNDAYRLESGRRSITSQIRESGLEARVVARGGDSYAVPDWPASGTFWQAGQENLLIADKQTAAYANGSMREREVLSRYAWGTRALPRAPSG